MSDTMRAVVMTAPMQLEVRDVPRPRVEDGGMLVKVEACGLCGSDLRTIRSGHSKVTLPWILGHEICGTVVATGNDYRGSWAPGDRLSIGPNTYDPTDPYCIDGRHELSSGVREIAQAWPGGFAEYVAIPPESVRLGNLLPAPDGMPSSIAAIVEPGSSVIHAHEKAGTHLGDTVLVMGTGPIGCLHLAVARASGASKVFVCDINEDRLAAAETFGPDALIHNATENVVERVRELTDGVGPSIVITANPSPASQVTAVEAAAVGGRVVLFGGLPHGDSTPGVDMNLVHYKNLTMIGISKFAPRHFAMSLALLRSGQIPGEKVVTDVMALDDFHAGLDLAMRGRAIKVVFTP